jgi:hypothetical protein
LENARENSSEIRRNFGSIKRTITLMIGLASPYELPRRARLGCVEISPKQQSGK